MSANCAAHGAPAIDTCKRCGVFLCELDRRPLDSHVYCERCVVLPEVDYLEAYRREFFGKRRDGWSWLFGVGGLANVTMALMGLARSLINGAHVTTLDLMISGLVFLPLGLVQLAWFFKQRWARVALPLLFLVLAGLLLSAAGPGGVAGLILPGAVLATAYTSVRSRLFFELDVPREALRKDWSLYHDNRLARTASSLAVGSLLIGPLGPLAIITGAIALRRVNPHSVPPVGNKRSALVGVILGSVTTVAWLAVAVILASTR